VAVEDRIEHGGFLEWTDFLGNYYGTPNPEPLPGCDTVLEIEVDGARQVKAICPEAILIFVLPPSAEEQKRRLRERGDPEGKVEQRMRKAEEEEPIGRAMADHVVVNDDLGRTVEEMLAIVRSHRARRVRPIVPDGS
jgi:guanylate kinase